ncbi:MAG: fibronectin type III domain-containing protein, partial [Planctomycetota bacterium]
MKNRAYYVLAVLFLVAFVTTFNYGGCSSFNGSGNNSGNSGSSDDPSVPTGLNASAVSSSQINLTWNASTDNVGVTGYKVYRNGSYVGPSSTTSYNDTGLAPSITYTYTVAAYDAAGNNSAQSSQASATTQGGGIVQPTVTTQAATDLTTTSATGNGNITDLGGAANCTARGFKYGLTQTDTWTASDSGSYGTGAYTKGITGLSTGTTYYIRAFATNSAGTGYGSYVSTTSVVIPTVTTQPATDLTTTSATGNGNITATGGANCTARGFKYGLTQTDTWTVSDSGSYGTGAYTKSITGLSPGTTYWYRAFATNSAGTGYGSYVSFTTTVVDYFIQALAAGTRDYVPDGGTLAGNYFTLNAFDIPKSVAPGQSVPVRVAYTVYSGGDNAVVYKTVLANWQPNSPIATLDNG